MIKFWIVDAFTKDQHRGNPAAVCYLDKFLSDEKMQEIANEFNLSETAFVCPNLDSGYNLRWFTPKCEVDLCGHATLATAAALYDLGLEGPYHFSTRSGILKVKRTSDGFAMDFPAQGEFSPFEQELNLQGLKIINQVRAHDDIILEVDSFEDLKAWNPDMESIKKFSAEGLLLRQRILLGEFDLFHVSLLPR